MTDVPRLLAALNNPRVTPSTFKDTPCLNVEGALRSYAILLTTHDVYALDNHRWISIVQTDTGSHHVDSLLTLVLALLNDAVMCKYIPTLIKHDSK